MQDGREDFVWLERTKTPADTMNIALCQNYLQQSLIIFEGGNTDNGVQNAFRFFISYARVSCGNIDIVLIHLCYSTVVMF